MWYLHSNLHLNSTWWVLRKKDKLSWVFSLWSYMHVLSKWFGELDVCLTWDQRWGREGAHHCSSSESDWSLKNCISWVIGNINHAAESHVIEIFILHSHKIEHLLTSDTTLVLFPWKIQGCGWLPLRTANTYKYRVQHWTVWIRLRLGEYSKVLN